MLDDLKVDLTVVLGKAHMPIHQLLRMGRGAVLALEGGGEDLVEVLANGHPIARAEILVTGDSVAIEIRHMIQKPEFMRSPGLRIGAPALSPSHEAGSDRRD